MMMFIFFRWRKGRAALPCVVVAQLQVMRLTLTFGVGSFSALKLSRLKLMATKSTMPLSVLRGLVAPLSMLRGVDFSPKGGSLRWVFLVVLFQKGGFRSGGRMRLRLRALTDLGIFYESVLVPSFSAVSTKQ